MFDGAEYLMNNRTINRPDWLALPQVKADVVANVQLDEKTTPAPGSAADGAGESSPEVCFDQLGRRRPEHPTVGAIEISTSPATSPTTQK
jgi:hypothetical protein